MHVTAEEFKKAMSLVDARFSKIDCCFDRLESEASDAFSFVRECMEVQRQAYADDFKRYFKEQNILFNARIERYICTLSEDFQSKLQAVGEKVDLTWEKCERKYQDLDENDRMLEKRVVRAESELLLPDDLPVNSGRTRRKPKKR